MGNGFLSPQSQLHLNDGGFATYLQITNFSTNDTLLKPKASDGFKLGIDSLGRAELRQQENADMKFLTNNTQRMTITSDGQLKINSLKCENCFVMTDKGGKLYTQQNYIAQLEVRIKMLEETIAEMGKKFVAKN